MNSYLSIKKVLEYLALIFLLSWGNAAQTDSSQVYPDFDSQLLKLRVPEAFQNSSLKLEVFSDSSWQLYQGAKALDFKQSLKLLGQRDVIAEYETHLARESAYIKDFRSRRVFSMVTAVGGASYLTFTWSKGWVYQIPGYAAILVAGVRYFESRKIEIEALREQYYLQKLISPAKVQALVDEYNFQLYQYLSSAGIKFIDS